MMGDPLGSSRVSSQKQNRDGVVGAQSGQYHVTVVEQVIGAYSCDLVCLFSCIYVVYS